MPQVKCCRNVRLVNLVPLSKKNTFQLSFGTVKRCKKIRHLLEDMIKPGK